MKRSLLICLLLLSLVAGTVSAQDDPGTILEVAGELEGLTTLSTALGMANPEAVEALSGEGPFTLFAPNDDAFSTFGTENPELLSTAMGDTDLLTSIFAYHVVVGEYTSETLAAELEASEEGVLELETVNGAMLTVSADEEGNVLVNDIAVVGVDNVASNGVVHVIEGVLVPPAEDAGEEPGVAMGNILDVAGELEGVTTLATALGMADPAALEVLASEGPFTLFAPNDDAFSAFGTENPELLSAAMGDTELLTNIFAYHVVVGEYTSETLAEELEASEEGVLELETVNGATLTVSVDEEGNVLVNDVAVVGVDNVASNGVVHVIEGVLVPPTPGTIIEVAGEIEGLTTLGTALGMADPAALEALAGEGPFTLFAPNDDAFSTFGTENPELLSTAMGDTELLTTIFAYHVVPGIYDAETLVAELEADDDGVLELPTLVEGATLTVTTDEDGNVLVNDILVVDGDYLASNGVVHVLEGVLVPPME